MTRNPDAYRCHREGHLPPHVQHLPDEVTLIKCPRCGKTARETGLDDHPEVIAERCRQADQDMLDNAY